MKIFEITDKNLLLITLRNYNLNFKNEYALILRSYSLFIKLKHLNKLSIVKSQADELISNLEWFINFDWPDKTDHDIIKLVNEAIDIKSKLESLTF